MCNIEDDFRMSSNSKVLCFLLILEIKLTDNSTIVLIFDYTFVVHKAINSLRLNKMSSSFNSILRSV